MNNIGESLISLWRPSKIYMYHLGRDEELFSKIVLREGLENPIVIETSWNDHDNKIRTFTIREGKSKYKISVDLKNDRTVILSTTANTKNELETILQTASDVAVGKDKKIIDNIRDLVANLSIAVRDEVLEGWQQTEASFLDVFYEFNIYNFDTIINAWRYIYKESDSAKGHKIPVESFQLNDKTTIGGKTIKITGPVKKGNFYLGSCDLADKNTLSGLKRVKFSARVVRGNDLASALLRLEMATDENEDGVITRDPSKGYRLVGDASWSTYLEVNESWQTFLIPVSAMILDRHMTDKDVVKLNPDKIALLQFNAHMPKMPYVSTWLNKFFTKQAPVIEIKDVEIIKN